MLEFLSCLPFESLTLFLHGPPHSRVTLCSRMLLPCSAIGTHPRAGTAMLRSRRDFRLTQLLHLFFLDLI